MTNRLFYLKYDFLSAFQHFKTKWIHSLLSLLGIIISIGSIIIMISISDGAKQKTLNNIKDLGINSIRIINKPLSNISNKNFNLSSGLNIRDYNLINNIIKKYGYSSMVIKLLDNSIYFNGGDTSGLVVGTNENFHIIEQ
ncbi:MAG: ABC transporter permease, partial [Campylobacterota bacterium]|nr:ABC transporter permease [Campylobacterota bacterium]